MGGHTSIHKKETQQIDLSANLQHLDEDYMQPEQRAMELAEERHFATFAAQQQVEMEQMIQEGLQIEESIRPIAYEQANLYRERIKTTSKSQKKDLADAQEERDKNRLAAVKGQYVTTNIANPLTGEVKIKDGEKYIYAIAAQDEAYNHLSPRVIDAKDIRMENAQKYGSSHIQQKDKKAADLQKDLLKKDVDNIVSNLKRDIVLEDSKTFPPEMEDMIDELFFANKTSSIHRKLKTEDFEEFQKNHNEEEIKQEKKRIKQVEEFTMSMKNWVTSYGRVITHLHRDIRALKLAKDQLNDELNASAPSQQFYYKDMIYEIDLRLAVKIQELEHQEKGYKTCDGNRGNSVKDDAMLALRENLANIRKHMKALDPNSDEYKFLENEAITQIKNFSYPIKEESSETK